MASLRRPSQFFGSKSDFSVPRPRAPRVGDPGRKRDARQSKVEEKMKTRRMSRYAGPDFGVGASGDDFLSSDPYQFTLDVAPPIMEADEYAEEPESLQPVRSARPTTTYQRPSPAAVNLQLDDDDDDEIQERNELQDEQIRPRAQEEWDFSELGKDDFDLQAYLRRTLAGADEQEKRRLVAALQRKKEETTRDLRQTVIKNYAEFVNVSKEMMTLENDMIELKELLTEWKTVPQLMGMDDSLAPTLNMDGTVERHRSRRNSPRDLHQMFRAQLSNLWSTVEGSQKFIPQTPGRRLVFETHGFIELNPATYKAKQNVSLFLLNDMLLVAGRRRVKASGVANGSSEPDQGRMVADRCWVLADLQITDVKDTGDLTNALKVKRGKDIFVFRCAKAEDKKGLLAALRQVSQDLLEKRRKDSEAEQERRRSMWQGDAANARMTRMSLFVSGEQLGGRPLSTIGTSLADSKDLLWIDEFADDLTMAIATQDWNESVKLVERGQDLMRTVSNNAEASEMLQYRLDTLRPTVIQKIALDLSSPDIRKTSAARLIAFLTRLDRAELARDTFLKARHDLVVRLVRSIKHEGDISLYINELAVVCFTVLRHTSDWYINAFQDNRMASGFVSWAKEQIEYFGDIFRRQVYAPAIDKQTVEECVRVTSSANRKLLRDVGLDFTFLIEALTAPPDAPASNRQTAHGFRPEMANFVPSIPTVPSPAWSGASLPTPSPEPELRGTTAPLAIPRRPSRDATLAPAPPSAMRSGSSTSVNSVSSGSRSPGNVPRPPPRSERRSRPPPPRPE